MTTARRAYPAGLLPRVGAFLDAFEALGLPPLETLAPQDARARMTALGRPIGRPVADVRDAIADGVPVRVYSDVASPAATILFFHAGGWVLGSLDAADAPARDVAIATRCRVVSVDYRLAPEHRFPAAADDASTAAEWAARAWPDDRLFVMGESAGGNLAAVAARRARDRGGPAIDGQILVCPVIDAAMDRPSFADYADGPLLTAPLMRWFWDQYLPDAGARADPDATPLVAALDDLPRALLLTAEHDVLRDEGEAYADALSAAGVAVERHCFAGQIHSFLSLGLDGPEATALERIADFVAADPGTR